MLVGDQDNPGGLNESPLDHRILAVSRHDTALVGGIITVHKPLHIGYECTVGFIVTKEDFLDEPPVSADLTAYDQAHLKLYMRLPDAEADGAAWEEGVQVRSEEHTPELQSLLRTSLAAFCLNT